VKIEAAAFVAAVIYLAVALGLRTLVQRLRTGDGGFNGVSGAPGSLEWLGGVGFIVAMALGLAAPLLQLAGLVDSFVPQPSDTQLWIAWIAFGVGVLLTLFSQAQMGTSWRIGVDEADETQLVTRGLFGYMRNPVFTGMLTAALGLTLLVPNAVSCVGWLALFAAIELQVRTTEEPYLLAAHGSEYSAYAANVGRFLPLIGRI
jgi:protein-S-isoprenylcysteine O-methyltransferase Ste14